MIKHESKLIIVTGATGFIGSALMLKLLESGYRVRALVRKSSLSIVPGVEYFYLEDFANNWQMNSIFDGCEIFFHLAGRVHIMRDHHPNSLSEYRKANVDLTRRLALQAVNSNVRRIVFLSTIKVNGEGGGDDKFLADDIPNPKDSYAISKLEAELALREISKEKGIEVVIVRPPLVYGPGVKGNFLSMIKAVKSKAPLPLEGFKSIRSYVFIDNLISLLLKVAVHPLAADQTFLVSDDHDISISELMQMIAKAFCQKIYLFKVPKQLLKFLFYLVGRKEVLNRLESSLRVDISKTKNLLNWAPPVKLEVAVEKTIQSFKK